MTLNQIIKRVQTIVGTHLQIRSFQFGNATEFLNDKTQTYPAVFLQDSGGNVSLTTKDDVLNFKMFCLDLVNVADKTKRNELDVQSDMLTVGKGILAMMNDEDYTDWSIGNATYELVEEQFNDMVAGIVFSFSIRTQWNKSYCEEPIL